MKLITLNMEMKKHYDTVLPFIENEDPEVLCLQEVPEEMTIKLEERGYYAIFLPSILRIDLPPVYPEGIMLASKIPFTDSHSEYYFEPSNELRENDDSDPRATYKKGYIVANIDSYIIATTHFTWTPNCDDPNEEQKTDLPNMLSGLSSYGPHILCGDMNIPRHRSSLYEKFLEHYTDTIPKKYSSSLDAAIHRLGSDPSKQTMFNDYMVDYIFTQSPYKAHNVRLEFGISDHTAVIADVSRA